MRWPTTTGLCVFLLFWGAAAEYLQGQSSAGGDSQRIEALIKQLGDEEFSQREAASRELEAIGEQAFPALRKAVAASDDFEIRQRAKLIIRTIMLGCTKSKSTDLRLTLIDPNIFTMGSPPAEPDRRADETPHKVKITEPFLLGVYEVTQGEYQKVMKHNPSWFTPAGGGKGKIARMETSGFPVEKVTWFDAIEFCNRLSKLDGYEPYYQMLDVKLMDGSIIGGSVSMLGGNGYRLPTEAQWEYACRAGTTKAFHFGPANDGDDANFKPGPSTGYGVTQSWKSLGRTAKVGSYAPNSWGLFDMHGNAAEWCWDWYDKDYYANSSPDDPTGPDKGDHRVLRGGSWLIGEGSCRSASRFWHIPNEINYVAGFRVARTP